MKETLGSQHGIRTWIEVDRNALSHNLKEFRNRLPQEVKIVGVVKSNAYGHGLVGFSKELVKLGVDWLAVDSIVEGIRLRKEGMGLPMLILGYTLPGNLTRAVDHDISVTVSSFETLDALKNMEREGLALPKIHIKLNTGMNRQGFSEEVLDKLRHSLRGFSDRSLMEGVYTHFAAADDPSYRSETLGQLELFERMLKKIKTVQDSVIIHASNAPATMNYSEAFFDMVRLGIGLYGIYPSPETKENSNLPLKRVLSWKTIVSEINTAKRGEGVGYGFTEKLSRNTKMAVCPIGYWHGYSRGLSGIGEVLIAGKRAKILGRVSMDMIVVDVTDIPDCEVGDEVVLIGRQGGEEVTAEELAEHLGTISYEVVTRINPLIKKFYI